MNTCHEEAPMINWSRYEVQMGLAETTDSYAIADRKKVLELCPADREERDFLISQQARLGLAKSYYNPHDRESWTKYHEFKARIREESRKWYAERGKL